jgi:hypothetical protein
MPAHRLAIAAVTIPPVILVLGLRSGVAAACTPDCGIGASVGSGPGDTGSCGSGALGYAPDVSANVCVVVPESDLSSFHRLSLCGCGPVCTSSAGSKWQWRAGPWSWRGTCVTGARGSRSSLRVPASMLDRRLHTPRDPTVRAQVHDDSVRRSTAAACAFAPRRRKSLELHLHAWSQLPRCAGPVRRPDPDPDLPSQPNTSNVLRSGVDPCQRPASSSLRSTVPLCFPRCSKPSWSRTMTASTRF